MSKYDKRRALFCKLIKKSDTHDGYYKYLVTVGEKDGSIHNQPVYGRDMQDAINRLIKKELTVKNRLDIFCLVTCNELACCYIWGKWN